MFDLAADFEKFYIEKVVLPLDIQADLRNKREVNVQRLKSGLNEYNEKNNSAYAVAETLIQGSMAMHTTIQNDNRDYDIDVAIMFDSSIIAGLEPRAVRDIVADAINRKRGNLSTPAEVKINCVRISYSEGYHVDFAIYRRNTNYDGTSSYEHGGEQWRSRDPRGIADWFSAEIEEKGEMLRKCVRLMKSFCKSRENWNMPAGLIQTVLCDEKMDTTYERLDECFYHLLVAVRNRLIVNKEVKNPTNSSISLIRKEIDKIRIENLLSHLSKYIEKLSILNDYNCTKSGAYQAWHEVFQHDFWLPDTIMESSSYGRSTGYSKTLSYRNTEKFVENEVNVNEIYSVNIDCDASADGFCPNSISKYIDKYLRKYLPHNLKLRFYIKSCNVPEPFEIWWKVRNVGAEAERRDCIRGQIIKSNSSEQKESTNFYGPHYVECYIIKNRECVAIGHIDVPIASA